MEEDEIIPEDHFDEARRDYEREECDNIKFNLNH
jgi:hypothetical protein